MANKVSRSIAELARAAAKARGGKAAGLELAEKAEGLAPGERLIVVADALTVALRKVPAPAAQPGAAPAVSVPARLAARLAAIEAVVEELLEEAPTLTLAEDEALREGGFAAARHAGEALGPAARAAAAYARLVHESCTSEQAAALLGVNASRIRQRLTEEPRTLYGVKVGKEWRVPKFQFAGKKLVPGIERVLAALPPGVHPVALQRWLSTPSPDLVPNEQAGAVSPLDWLKMGHDPEVVAELAGDL